MHKHYEATYYNVNNVIINGFANSSFCPQGNN